METIGGGTTVVVGGLLHPARQVAAGDVAFVHSGGGTSLLTCAIGAWEPGNGYCTHMVVDGEPTLVADDLPGRTEHGQTVLLHGTG